MANVDDEFSPGYDGPGTGYEGAIRIIDHLLALARKPEGKNE